MRRLLGVAALVLTASLSASDAARPGWVPIPWPFPRDAWPAGLAFACPAATCGNALRLYIRPKRGFCANCTTGVTSDAEVDAVADLDLIADDFVPLATGETLTVGDMAGRQRSYMMRLPHGGQSPAIGMAMTRRRQCDLVVAVADGAVTDRAQGAIAALLISDRVALWIGRQLDGR